MAFKIFFKEIVSQYPKLLLKVVSIVLLMTGMDVLSIISLAPIIDLLNNTNEYELSVITRHLNHYLNLVNIKPTLMIVAMIWFIFSFLKNLLSIWAYKSILVAKYKIQEDLMLGTFKSIFNARWSFFVQNKQGVINNTFLREIAKVGDSFKQLAEFFVKIVQVIVYISVPLFLSWQLTMVSLLSAIILSAPFLFLGKIGTRLGRQDTATGNEIGVVVSECITAAKIILGFGNQLFANNRLKNAFNAHRKITIKRQTFSIAIPRLYMIIASIIIVVALTAASRLAIPLSNMAVILYGLMKVLPIIGQIAERKNLVESFFPSLEQTKNIRLEAKSHIQDSGNIKFDQLKEQISLNNLYFSYTKNVSVLKDINISIPTGKMIAVVGESGSGKSSLVDVLIGFNKPQSGSIKIDNIPLQEYDINSFRKKIGYVPQDPILFNMTISENIKWAKINATMNEVRDACRYANALHFIEEFPEGFDTIVGDRGIRLSGGQLQRIALARAIIRQPELLILDEATSALDSKSERAIQMAIEKISTNTTLVVIAHRLSTIIKSDYIYVLNKGLIIEEGDYHTLCGQNSHFKQMVHEQQLIVDN